MEVKWSSIFFPVSPVLCYVILIWRFALHWDSVQVLAERFVVFLGIGWLSFFRHKGKGCKSRHIMISMTMITVVLKHVISVLLVWCSLGNNFHVTSVMPWCYMVLDLLKTRWHWDSIMLNKMPRSFMRLQHSICKISDLGDMKFWICFNFWVVCHSHI